MIQYLTNYVLTSLKNSDPYPYSLDYINKVMDTFIYQLDERAYISFSIHLKYRYIHHLIDVVQAIRCFNDVAIHYSTSVSYLCVLLLLSCHSRKKSTALQQQTSTLFPCIVFDLIFCNSIRHIHSFIDMYCTALFLQLSPQFKRNKSS